MTKKSAQIAFDDVLRQVTEGNEEAFQQLYLHYHDRLFQFARMYLHQQQAAEDVVADLFFNCGKAAECSAASKTSMPISTAPCATVVPTTC